MRLTSMFTAQGTLMPVLATVLLCGLRGSALAQTPPLPDIPSLFKEALENQEKLEKERTNYTYTQVADASELDGEGRVKKTSVNTYEVFHAFDTSVEKLVARNGRTLSAEESGKEAERLEKKLRELQRKAAGRKAEAERATTGTPKGDDDDITVARMLRVCRFTNPRREAFRGHEAVVFDFEPNKDGKPKGRVEAMIQKLAGHVWIDEAAKRLVRIEARVTDTIKIAGGLFLSLHRGSSMVLEQELVNGEVWLPSYSEVNVSARFLLVKGFRTRQTQRFSDYRKFNVETSSEITPLKP